MEATEGLHDLGTVKFLTDMLRKAATDFENWIPRRPRKADLVPLLNGAVEINFRIGLMPRLHY